MSLASEVAGLLFTLGGLFFLFVAAVGVWRLPDVYCRAHALGKAMTLGVILLLIGFELLVPEMSWWKVVVAILFQLVGIPVASHLLCLIGYRRRVRRWSAHGWIGG